MTAPDGITTWKGRYSFGKRAELRVHVSSPVMLSRGRKWLYRLSAVLLGPALILTFLTVLDRVVFVSLAPTPHLFPPHVRLVQKTSEFECAVDTNALGMRGGEPAKAKSKLRVLALGDSFTFGWGVNLEATWLKTLERDLAARGCDVEILNGGRPGYYPELYLQVGAELVPRLKPDVVLVAILQGDDLAQSEPRLVKKAATVASALRSWCFPYWSAWRSQQQMSLPTTAAAFTQSWKDRARRILDGMSETERTRFSALPPKLRDQWRAGDLNPGLLSGMLRQPARLDWTLHPETPLAQVRASEMTKQLCALKRLAEEHQARILVVSVPHGPYVERRQLDTRRLMGFQIDEAALVSLAADQVIADCSAAAGTPFLTVFQAFRQASAEPGLYFEWDGHFSASGHETFAKLLTPELRAYLRDR